MFQLQLESPGRLFLDNGSSWYCPVCLRACWYGVVGLSLLALEDVAYIGRFRPEGSCNLIGGGRLSKHGSSASSPRLVRPRA
jgi:hypothetical protein